ncbi:hypothetical protein CTAYLR_009856 [Chrysophaeum taylorii]|uniref:Cell division protein ZapE n=1 Tax=Chrysophaeum taylorii TaxID=2483200 RepID=A0AAD7U616_9STRA|nr:hypothetical protein CTAYLR_009856 [Chrysophaeum taylorii]
MGVGRVLQERVVSGTLKSSMAQAKAAKVLDRTLRGCILRKGRPWVGWSQRLLGEARGVYLSGAVGSGKTLLMDTLHVEARAENVATLRVHWHEWIGSVHRALHEARNAYASQTRKLRALGDALAHDTQLVCFDELAVHDVADALMLREIFARVLERGAAIVATSNRDPRDLYENGINRELFLPFIALLERHLVHCDLDTLANESGEALVDYRRDAASDGLSLYVTNGSARDVCAAVVGRPLRWTKRRVPVSYGRSIEIADDEVVATAHFEDLCARPLSAADYASLADRYDALVLTRVPQLSMQQHDQVRRLLWLVDILYDARMLLVIEADVPVDDLLDSGGFSREEEANTVLVRNHGGSSGRLTTIVGGGGGTEWSATGRIGASLGSVAGVTDARFAWSRLTSRLVEMTRSTAYLAAWRQRCHGRIHYGA